MAPVAGAELAVRLLPVPVDFAGEVAGAELDVEPPAAPDAGEDDLGAFTLAVLPDAHGVLDGVAALDLAG